MKLIKLFLASLTGVSLLLILSDCKKKELPDQPAPDRYISELPGIGNMILRSNGQLCLVGVDSTKDVALYYADTSGRITNKTYLEMDCNGFDDVRVLEDAQSLIIFSKLTEVGKGETFSFRKFTNNTKAQFRKYLLPQNTFGISISTLADGYLLTGGIFDSALFYRDVYLMKIDKNLDTVWTRTYGSPSNDVGATGRELCDGTIGVLAYSDTYGAGSRDFWYLKLDKNGDTLKTVTFGGSGYEEPQDMAIDNDCNVILAGHTASFGHPEHNAYLVKCSPDGNLIWQNNYGSIDHDGFHAVNLYDNGNKIIAVARSMSTNTSTMQEDNLIIKTDKNGNQLDSLRIGVPIYDDVPLNALTLNNTYFLLSKYVKAGTAKFSFYKGQLN